MKKIKLGSIPEKVSEICLGTMYFGSKVNQEKSFELLDWYIDRGGNFIDTANNYAHWIDGCDGTDSERLLGKWIQERQNREKIFLATKMGFDKKGIGMGLKADQIIDNCNKSLSYLGTDHIDLLYAHMDDESTPLDETLEAFDQLIKAGKVRYIGASNHVALRLMEALHISNDKGYAGYRCLQNRHTYLRINQGVDTSPQVIMNDEMITMCQNKGIGMLAYSPLLQGAYCFPDQLLPQGYESPANRKRLSVLEGMARRKGVTLNQLVFAWMMGNQIIPLMTGEKIEHLEENVKAQDIELTIEELTTLNNA